jgi:transcriptional regulator with XRE-family HTH domain
MAMTGNDLRTLRAALGLSQEALAEKIGITKRQLIRYEAGMRHDVTDQDGAPRPVRIPRYIALAAAAIKAGIAADE